MRKNIYYILWLNNRPLKAYEILSELLFSRPQARPITVYRVLEYLIAEGLVHKLESLQSFTICHLTENHKKFEFLLICNQCHRVQEIEDNQTAEEIQTTAAKNHFNLNQTIIELKGKCWRCNV